MSKTELLLNYLQEKGATVNPRRMRCAFPERHPRGDRNPSASIDTNKGRYHCWSCDLHGDVFDIMSAIDGLTYGQALTTLGGVASTGSSEETWL